MAKATIYHNPRCTKSRQTLALLREKGVELEIVEYLDQPPDASTLATLVKKLGIEPAQLIRKKEYRELGLPETDDTDELLALMAANPKIIERPIVCRRFIWRIMDSFKSEYLLTCYSVSLRSAANAAAQSNLNV